MSTKVLHIQSEAFPQPVSGMVVVLVYLRQSGQSRFDAMPSVEVWNEFSNLGTVLHRAGPWTNERHFALEYIPELGQFIQV